MATVHLALGLVMVIVMEKIRLMVMTFLAMIMIMVTVMLPHVKIKVYGIVAMANVSQQAMYVMAQVNFVTQVGVLTVPMVQMKA